MQEDSHNSLVYRLRNLVIFLGAALAFVYVFLPLLTRSFDTLSSMSDSLDENGIDPTRYYYTDVEQVKEAELYLESVLQTK
jgi:hypothetical protein